MENEYDFLVIGSGIAGLSFAIKAAELGSVAIVTKKEKVESNTNYAQGGIAAVTDNDDNFESHINDTLKSGAGLCNEDVVRFVVTEGPERIRELIEWGVNFTKTEGSTTDTYDLGREGGHSRRRVLHAEDLTGREIERALIEKATSKKNITIYENFFSIDLICKSKLIGHKEEEDRCLGAYVFDVDKTSFIPSERNLSCSPQGGLGKVYLITTNPDIATGDGVGNGLQGRCRDRQHGIHTVSSHLPVSPRRESFLISEAVRGEGAVLKLKDGSSFMEKYHPMGALAPRDVVAKAIDTELKKSGDEYVLLDISHMNKDFLVKRFPYIYNRCLEFDIDMAVDPIPVVPAAHYQCGGVLVNPFGQTSIDRLFAFGEVACTGLHGANRLASNSLLEALVFSHRAFLKAKELLPAVEKESLLIPPWDPKGATESDESIVVAHNWDEIRMCMWNYVGIVRSDKRLERAKRRIDMIIGEIEEYYRNFTITTNLLELRNIATVAEVIIECSRLRKESRGLHYNLDYPERDDVNWIKDTVVIKINERWKTES